MSSRKILLLLALLNSLLFAQNNIGMNLNNEDIELQGSWDIVNLTDYSNGTHYLINANYLHTKSDSFKTGEHFVQVGLFAQNSFLNTQALLLSFGMKAVMTNDYIAIVPSGKAQYTLDLGLDVPPTFISAEVSYAPSLLSFMDATSYTDFRVEADMEVIPNILLYGGYRHIETAYVDYTEALNDSLFAGMKITF